MQSYRDETAEERDPQCLQQNHIAPTNAPQKKKKHVYNDNDVIWYFVVGPAAWYGCC